MKIGYLALVVTLFVFGCGQPYVNNDKPLIYGIVRFQGHGASVIERAQLTAEAKALRLVQLCQGGEFLVEQKNDGSINTTLKAAVELTGINCSRVEGLDGFNLVACPVPVTNVLPKIYFKIKPKEVWIAGDGDKAIKVIDAKIAEYGKLMLATNVHSQGALYAIIQDLSFNVKTPKPSFHAKLLLWFKELP